MSWPTSSTTPPNLGSSDTKTFTQAKDASMAKDKSEADARYAELNKKYDDLKKQVEKLMEDVKSVNVHKLSDVDSNTHAQHHTIGLGPNNVTAGIHNHDGVTSARLDLTGTSLAGAIFTGANLSGAVLLSTDNQASLNIIPERLLAVANPTGMRLLNGGTLTGSRASDTWRQAVTTALVRLGMGNSTSA